MENKNWTFQFAILPILLAFWLSQFLLKDFFFHNKINLLLKSKGTFMCHRRRIFNIVKGNTSQQTRKQISSWKWCIWAHGKFMPTNVQLYKELWHRYRADIILAVNNSDGSFEVGLYHTLARTRQQQWPKGNTTAFLLHKWWPSNKNI